MAQGNKNQKSIMLVEDDRILADAMTLKLKQSGFQVFKCENGDEAVAEIKSHTPDLVLLDIILPKVKGTTIIRQLKGDQATAHIPVIMMTNLSPRPSLMEELKGCEPRFFFVKSESTLEEILEKVRETLR